MIGAHRALPAVRFVAALLSTLLLIAAVYVLVLDTRVRHVPLNPPAGAPGQTWVIVGSDSRADIPAGAAQSSFGSTAEVSGARADIVLIVHRTATGQVFSFSVPRDILVHNRSGQLNRLALAYQVSPQNLVDSLCATLNVPTDHLVVVDFAVFTSVVDALGGITVDLPTPVRDRFSGLDLETAGRQRQRGDQALALIRSRHTERQENGTWTAVPDGPTQRTSWGGSIFTEIERDVAGSSNPLVLQRLAWIVSGSMQTDEHTSLSDLADLAVLASDGGPMTDLPADAKPGVLAVTASAQTYAVLAAAGFDRTCR